MKYYFSIFILLFLLTSCHINNEPTYILGNYNQVYAYNDEFDRIDLVNTEYELNGPKDVFLLYTTNQNYLPIGYSSGGYTTINLLSCVSNETCVYYYTDDGIYNLKNLDLFINLLTKTNLLLYDKETIIINNYRIIS